MIKKIFLLMFVFVFLVGSVSAFEFDNVGEYNRSTRTMTIVNAFGLGDDIAEIELLTPLYNEIHGAGYQSVAKFQVREFSDYDNAFKELELFDKKGENNKFLRDYDFKTLSYEMIDVDDYGLVPIGVYGNGTTEYEQQVIGSHQEQREKWTKLTPANFKKNDVVTVGIFTEVLENDSVEWIPNMFGIRIDEWASWEEIGPGTFIDTDVVYTAFVGTATLEQGVSLVPNEAGHFIEIVMLETHVTADTVYIWNSSNVSIAQATVVSGNATFDPVVAVDNGAAYFVVAKNDDDSTYTYAQENPVPDPIKSATEFDYVCGKASDGVCYPAWAWNIQGVQLQGAMIPLGNVTLNSPVNEFNTTVSSVDFNGTVSSANGVANVSLYINGTLEQTNSSGVNATDYLFTDTLSGLGSFNWTYGVCDVSSNCFIQDSRNISFTTDLNITNLSPVADLRTNISSLLFNGTASDDTAVINVSFYINDILNQTNTSGLNNTVYSFNQTFIDGVRNWSMEVCDAFTCVISDARNFTIHTIPSTIELFTPSGDQGSFSIGDNLTLSWSISETGENLTEHIQNCSFVYNSVQTFLNLTQCIEINETSFLYIEGENNLTFVSEDEFNVTSTNMTFWSFTFLETGVGFNSTVFETDSQNFELNLTTSINLITVSSVLNYNGTEDTSVVSCSSGDCTITNKLDIPLVGSEQQDQNKTFFWDIQIFNGTDSIQINTSDRNQTVSMIHLEVCNATFTNQSLNFTCFDEATLATIDPFQIALTADFWLGEGAVKRNNSIENSSLASMQLCLDPINRTFFLDADVAYDQVSPSQYTARNYFFQNDSITNTSQDIELGLLNTTDSTTFILRVQDTNILPVEDVIIITQRWYPGEGIFRTVQVGRTDDNGKTVGFFKQETVDYRFILKQQGEIVLITDTQKIIGEELPFTLTFTIGADVGKPWEPLEGADNLSSNLTWNPTTQLVSWIYSDISGNFEESQLLVQFFNASGANTEICNTTSDQSSATLGCDLSNNATGTYVARTFITRSGVQSLVQQFTFELEEVSDIYGRMGLFGGFFILVACAFIFKFNEIAGILAMNAGVIAVNSLGLIAFGKVFVTAMIAVSVLIIFVLER